MSDDGQRTVLIVEDNEDDQHLARRVFRDMQRPEIVLVAANGEEALEILRSGPSPVLVLLDLNLPRLSGVDVLIAMKDDARLRTVPVVVLTSSNDMTDIGACYELGCSAFVRKPVEFQEFRDAIATTLKFWLSINLTLVE